MPKVLLVDDAAFMRMRCAKLLTENGYSVDEAENGQEAVEKYAKIKPDLVLMDITMPVMDGLTAVAEIKKIDPEAKIVMCSALGQQNTVMSAIKAGAKDFIIKPYQSDKILTTIKRFVG